MTTLIPEIRIRELLLSFLNAKGTHKVVEELGSPSLSVFFDVVALGDSLIGFEIKSDYDELSRLPLQIVEYEKIFDYNYLVVGHVLLERSIGIIPSSWGILLALEDRLVEIRSPAANTSVSLKERMSYLNNAQLKKITKKKYSKELSSELNKNIKKAIIHTINVFIEEDKDIFSEHEINQMVIEEIIKRRRS